MLTYCTAVVIVGFASVVFGDTATAAAVAGIFASLNLVLNAILLKKTSESKQVATEAKVEAIRSGQIPRRFVYDQQGHIIGSVPENDRGDLHHYQPVRKGGNVEGGRWHEQ